MSKTLNLRLNLLKRRRTSSIDTDTSLNMLNKPRNQFENGMTSRTIKLIIIVCWRAEVFVESLETLEFFSAAVDHEWAYVMRAIEGSFRREQLRGSI